jgi:hypothetical protein
VKSLAEQVGGMDSLKRRAAECDSLSIQLIQASKDNQVLSDQFKKESGLRRSYKNELEDLKGAIRVYARCRPMVSYERDRGCKQVMRLSFCLNFPLQLETLSCVRAFINSTCLSFSPLPSPLFSSPLYHLFAMLFYRHFYHLHLVAAVSYLLLSPVRSVL